MRIIIIVELRRNLQEIVETIHKFLLGQFIGLRMIIRRNLRSLKVTSYQHLSVSDIFLIYRNELKC